MLFDQGTPAPLRKSLTSHEVITAYEQRWSQLQNGELIAAAEVAGFEVFVTTDKISSTSRIWLVEAWQSLFCLPPAGQESKTTCPQQWRRSIKRKKVASLRSACQTLPKFLSWRNATLAVKPAVQTCIYLRNFNSFVPDRPNCRTRKITVQ